MAFRDSVAGRGPAPRPAARQGARPRRGACERIRRALDALGLDAVAAPSGARLACRRPCWPGRRPRPRCRGRPLRPCRPRRRARRAPRDRGLPRRAGGAADPCRHPLRAGHQGRRRTRADRTPEQGPRVAGRRRGRRPGGRVARPAPPRLAAAVRTPRHLRPVGPTALLPLSARLAEERRLFYVATTRARRRLVVTAVDSPEDDGVRPSPLPGRARGRRRASWATGRDAR